MTKSICYGHLSKILVALDHRHRTRSCYQLMSRIDWIPSRTEVTLGPMALLSDSRPSSLNKVPLIPSNIPFPTPRFIFDTLQLCEPAPPNSCSYQQQIRGLKLTETMSHLYFDSGLYPGRRRHHPSCPRASQGGRMPPGFRGRRFPGGTAAYSIPLPITNRPHRNRPPFALSL